MFEKNKEYNSTKEIPSFDDYGASPMDGEQNEAEEMNTGKHHARKSYQSETTTALEAKLHSYKCPGNIPRPC
jgi:hypothetical protein